LVHHRKRRTDLEDDFRLLMLDPVFGWCGLIANDGDSRIYRNVDNTIHMCKVPTPQNMIHIKKLEDV
jgi:hypothetical protein